MPVPPASNPRGARRPPACRFFREKQAKHFSRPDDLTLQLKRALRSLFYLFNLHTLVLLTLACAAVYVCHREGWR